MLHGLSGGTELYALCNYVVDVHMMLISCCHSNYGKRKLYLVPRGMSMNSMMAQGTVNDAFW
jgi:hypothetical protein